MLIVKYTNLFKKDLKRVQKRGLNIELLKDIVAKLANNETLPEQNRDHFLTNNYKRI